MVMYSYKSQNALKFRVLLGLENAIAILAIKSLDLPLRIHQYDGRTLPFKPTWLERDRVYNPVNEKNSK